MPPSLQSQSPLAPTLSPTAAATFFHTPRLLIRAVEDSDADASFIHALESDPTTHLVANGGLQKPRNRGMTQKFRDWLMNDALIGVIVCLKPNPDRDPSTSTPEHEISDEKSATPEPIGFMSLDHQFGPIHRSAVVGISVVASQRAKGYGEEALRWLLRWGFQAGGLHRIEIGHFSWNEGAGRMYRRLGFEEEGRRKECFWFWGGWGDEVVLGMTEGRWRVLEGEREGREEAV